MITSDELLDREQVSIMQGSLQLLKLAELNDTRQICDESLEIFQKILDANIFCIYLADDNQISLSKMSSYEPTSVFPESIPYTELLELFHTSKWFKGKRVTTEIHRAARIAGLGTVISTPLKDEESVIGLLVVGCFEGKQDNQLVAQLEYFGNFLTNILQNSRLTNNLRSSGEKQARQIEVSNTLFESIDIGVIILNPDFSIADMNGASEEIFGYNKREVCDKPVDTILIGKKPFEPTLRAAFNGIAIRHMGVISLLRRNGQLFPAEVQFFPVKKDGDLVSIIVTVVDVSESEQIRARTQQMENRAFIGNLVQFFAHEIRNPINNISTGLQLFALKLANSDSSTLDLVKRIQVDSQRLTDLMETLLAYSRPMQTRFKELNICFLIERILDRWRPRMDLVHVTALLQVEENIPKIIGDASALEQVFTNLISNAVEAMNKTGGALVIKVENAEKIGDLPQIIITVSDTGPGIPAEAGDIFEPFVSNKAQGTGLGLVITKQIITAHQGSIKWDSFPGGTIFTIQLPAIDGE
jgi:PAS domain S-box-containing protein